MFNGPVGEVPIEIGNDPVNPNPEPDPGNDEVNEDFDRCATTLLNDNEVWSERQAQLIEDYEELSATQRATIITIPVVFHVIHYGEAVGTGRNISVAQLQSQLDVLNEDFRKLNIDIASVMPQFASIAADVEVQFCLAVQDPNGNASTGINRYYYNTPSWTWQTIEMTVKPATSWNPSNYLNFWVADVSYRWFSWVCKVSRWKPIIRWCSL